VAPERYGVSVQFRILGPVEIETDGGVVSLPRRRERCLLGVLLLEANRVVSVDRLAELLWDDEPPKRVRGAVQGHVSRLRAALAGIDGGRGVELGYAGEGYRMVVDLVDIDAHRFRTQLDEAAVVTDPVQRVEKLRAALDLWRGPALADSASGRLRERLCSDLEERRLAAIENLASTSLTLGREREILPQLAGFAGENPGRESLAGLHMLALYQAGRRADALDVYARTRNYLADELGLDPGPDLRELHQAVLRDESVASRQSQRTINTLAKPPRHPPRVIPRQLPADVAGFTGRLAHIDKLDSLLPLVLSETRSVVISAIGRTAGVGKTALAVRWAHRVADQFPDGQLYVNLRGFDPSGKPMEPADAVLALLDGLQVPPQRIPASLDAQVGLYRSLLAGRRMLVLLDNARNAEQVRPLLPGTAGCLAVVTSRDQLSSLAVREGAQVLALDVLSDYEARQLLERRLGRDRVAAEPEAVEEIISLCARLPLALAVVAARAAAQADFPLHVLMDRLREADRTFDILADSDAASDVRTVFSWSYRALDADAARLFRLLGLHPGPDIAAPAAASLAAIPVTRARQLLTELVQDSLLTEHVPGRYTFHDLLRAYAGELARRGDPAEDFNEAGNRLLDHYLATAHAANLVVYPERTALPLPPRTLGAVVEPPVSPEAGFAWLTIERSALVAAVRHAANSGFEAHAWRLAWALGAFLDRAGHWRDQIAVQSVALAAAHRLADRFGQAGTHRMLGLAYARFQDWRGAEHHLRQALEIYSELGEHLSQASVHTTLGMMCDEQGRYEEALYHARRHLELARLAKHRHAEATGLYHVGWMHTKLGDYQQAVTHSRQAVEVFQEINSPDEEAEAWDVLGYANHHLGNHDDAVACYQRALAGFSERADRYNRAQTLNHLGNAHDSAGDLAAAGSAWTEALSILDELGHPGADEVRDRLDGLSKHNPPSTA
jgi:DNA-binding SARP family transcriptional activator/Tfp pilus assembly protein PilF